MTSNHPQSTPYGPLSSSARGHAGAEEKAILVCAVQPDSRRAASVRELMGARGWPILVLPLKELGRTDPASNPAIFLAIIDDPQQDIEPFREMMTWAGNVPVIAVTGGPRERTVALKLIDIGAQDCLSWNDGNAREAAALDWAMNRIIAIYRRAPRGELILAQESAEAMLILDREGRVQFLNEEAAAFLGRPAASLLGAAFPFALSAVNSNSEIHFEHADGSRRHAEMRVIETQWGTRPARIVSLSDISLRRQLEIALSRASLKERNRISARQSHTIQAAVSEIDKCAAIIRDAAAGPLDARYRSYAGKICDSSKEILASLDLPVDTIAPQDA